MRRRKSRRRKRRRKRQRVAGGGGVGGGGTVANVAVAHGPQVGDAVADDLVDGGAARLGELVVVERRRVAVAFQAGLVRDPVDLVRRHAHRHRPRRLLQHLPSQLQPRRPTHRILFYFFFFLMEWQTKNSPSQLSSVALFVLFRLGFFSKIFLSFENIDPTYLTTISNLLPNPEIKKKNLFF